MNKVIHCLIFFAFIALTVFAWITLPDTVITHWGVEGTPDGYSGKAFGILLFPIMVIILNLLFRFLPGIDPLKENYKKFGKSYETFIAVFNLFLLMLFFIFIFLNMCIDININRLIIPLFAFLFFSIGVILKDVKDNWFIGIRTPWTLSSKEVWRKTHQLGSVLFEAGAIVSLVGIFFPEYAFAFVLIPILLVSVILIVYSYMEHKKLFGK